MDHHFDDNSIGALLIHITSSEKFHQVGTLERDLDEEELKIWQPAQELRTLGKEIKGHPIDYYFDLMDHVRADSIQGLKRKDDEWLLKPDSVLSSAERPVNKFWRWFHTCEHISNHNGQIKFLKFRLPE